MPTILLLGLTCFLLVAPLLFPLVELARQPAGFRALLETPRIASLIRNTLGLAVGATTLAVPVGIAVGALVERGRVRYRMALRGLVLLGVVLPLPVYAAAWQAVFGLTVVPDAGGWRPWVLGLLPAIWVHAVAGLPWVAVFVMLALRSADPQLEDDAQLAGGRRAVWRGVLWPRVRLAAFAGACWVVIQAFTEATVTDLFMVRTFAEEVYFQLVGNPAGVAAAVAVTLPVWFLAALIAVAVLKCVAATDTVIPVRARAPTPLAGTRAQTALVWFTVCVLVGVPFLGLTARIGELGLLAQVARAHGSILVVSIFWSGLAGLSAATLALGVCWRARDSWRCSALLVVLTAVAWVTPAPLVGFGLKSLIGAFVSLEDAILGSDAAFAPLRSLLYDQPSPVPGIWAAIVRFFPFAVAVLWPAVRAIPQELIDAAILDGGRPAVLRSAVWPGVRGAFALAVVAVGLLSLGEVVATKLVQPPGRRSFAADLFDAMHYGADATVAGMCMLQIAVTGVIVACLIRRLRD
ncbi:MAG: hypothetical protein C0467_10945 [Planctomycetaceae bacterium]|nr:hypothetical protein [Planctomycetaceae bacterium]